LSKNLASLLGGVNILAARTPFQGFYNEITPEPLGSNAGLVPTPRWRTCATYGDAVPHACGCPECVREMCGEITRLRAALATANAQAERFERLWQVRGAALEKIVMASTTSPCARKIAADELGADYVYG